MFEVKLLSCLTSLLLFCNITSAQQPTLVLPIGHTRSVTGGCFSPDGKYALTTSTDLTAKIWEVSSGKLLHTMAGHDAMEIYAYSFSPDGKYVMTTNYSGVNVWETVTGKLSRIMRFDEEMIISAEFSPDGKYMIGMAAGQKIRIWKMENVSKYYTLTTPNTFKKTYFNKDGKYFVATENNGNATIFETETGATMRQFNGKEFASFPGGFNLNGESIVTTTETGFIKVWDVRSGKQLVSLPPASKYKLPEKTRMNPGGSVFATLNKDDDTAHIRETSSGNLLYSVAHKKTIDDICFSNDGKYLLTGSMDGNAKIFDAKTGGLLRTLSGHSDWVWRIAFSNNARYIITASSDNTAGIWETATGKLMHTLKGHTDIVYSLGFSSDRKYILTTTWENNARIWDVETGKLVQTLSGHKKSVNSAFFSTDNKWVVTAGSDQTVKLWETATGKLIRSLDIAELDGQQTIYIARFSPDDKHIIAGADHNVKVWESLSGKLISSFKIPSSASYANFLKNDRVIFTSLEPRVADLKTGKIIYALDRLDHASQPLSVGATGKYIATLCPDTIKVWDMATGKLLYKIPGMGAPYRTETLDISPDEKYLAAGLNDNTVKIWDLTTGNLLRTLYGHTAGIWTVRFSNNGKWLASGSFDNTARIWDVARGQPYFELKGHGSAVNVVEFSPGDTYIATASFDSKNKRWDMATGKEICTSTAVDANDFFVQVPGGYYMSTSSAVKQLHYLTSNYKIISFEQLDVKYNRPDKVLEALGNTDINLIRSYRKAYEKRIRKLGIDTTAFREGYSVPEADFVNRDSIPYEQHTGTLSLHFKGSDPDFKLDRFNIWVNESPVFGQRGIRLRRKNSNSIDTVITIRLSQGENRIEASVINENGTESYRMPLTVFYTPAEPLKETTRFIGIGIEQFSNSKYNLQYSVKDIRDLSLRLKEKYGPDIIIDTLFNQNVTVAGVKALKEKLLQTTVNDKVIIAYSGHGMLSKEFDYYLSTYSVNFDNPEQNGLSYDELENLLDSIPARKKLMLIDACHSGEVDKEDLVKLNAGSESLIKGLKPVAYKKDGQLGLQNSFELMQSLFVNVGKSTGATIISAAAGTQFALERNDLKNGVFTYAILEAMKTYPTLKISELKKIVGERVEELTKGLQKPTSRNETIAVDWKVW